MSENGWLLTGIAFGGFFLAVPIFLGFLRFLGFYAVVQERTCQVYVLFGKVVTVIEEPGLHFLWLKMGLKAPVVRWIGKLYVVDMRLDQTYMRSQPVNSEEGAPMGIGIWYEMYISDPLAFLFKNTDPRGSLRANVSNATVRCLSNMKLGEMLQTRHLMSETVRNEVSPKSHEWGYRLGSVYIRKVHFRDAGMIAQIEEKVVNRLRQVTSAIRQEGQNQVSLISSAAEREAAVDFAKAAALRPEIVGAALRRIGQDAEVSEALFEVLENQALVASGARLTLVPPGQAVLPALLAARAAPASGPAPAGRPVPAPGRFPVPTQP
ncbi:MAG TPA: SPFH domain-containing protein [Myxococcota bacterium]|nr:SPFH domain-containing protein [Myxococcota bacterium]HRY95807.1 SPFH domain-containing protein [Myxococcota bacterium]HSA22761.1 SPFH domain-containing protein [Myxococcota bacterium]